MSKKILYFPTIPESHFKIMYVRNARRWGSIQILGWGLKCPVHRSSVFRPV